MTEPTPKEIDDLVYELRQAGADDTYSLARAVLAKWGAPSAVAQEPCPTCIALARTVMLDQVSFDRKPDCYGIRQITDDEGIEEWEDIRTSPDVAREEANDMMATGRGEIYEVVPLWTTPQPTQPQAGAEPLTDEQIDAVAESMPGGLAGFLKGWGWRQFAREILTLRRMPDWEPQFDCMTPKQEELALQFCQEIAGPRGKRGSPPDPVRLLEMAEALYKAEREHHHGIKGGQS